MLSKSQIDQMIAYLQERSNLKPIHYQLYTYNGMIYRKITA